MLWILLVFNLICVINGDVPFITKCHYDDSKCATESARRAIPVIVKGLPEYGVEKLDPLHFKKIKGDTGSLKLTLNDVSIGGLSGCEVLEARTEKLKLFLKLQCDVTLTGQYEIGGSLLVVPFEGNGDIKVVLRKMILSVDNFIKEIDGKDGKKHWAVHRWEHKFDLKGKSDIHLSNLFNGNEILAQAAKSLLETSSNEVAAEVGPTIVQATVKKIVEAINRLYKKVPLEDLVLL